MKTRHLTINSLSALWLLFTRSFCWRGTVISQWTIARLARPVSFTTLPCQE
jgi:hypothetical protein